MNKKSFIVLALCLMIFTSLCGQDTNESTLKTGWYYVSEQKTNFKRLLDGSSESYFINPDLIVSVDQFNKIELVENEYDGKKQYSLIIKFDKKGTDNWSIATQKAIGKQLALIIDDKLVYVPKVNAQITSGVSSLSRSEYTKEDIGKFVKQIEEENKSIKKDLSILYAINLPEPQKDGLTSIEKNLNDRRSRRRFEDKVISLENLSQILWAAYGITKPLDNSSTSRDLHTAPSAGALYPLEIYVAAGKVEGLEPGLYKYIPKGHKLNKVIDKDIREEICFAALGQKMLQEAPVSIIYTAVFARTTKKYGERGQERYVYIDLGHSAQNVYLQAEALGLGTCAVGAFSDAKLTEVLKLPEEETILYVMPIGHYDK